MDNELTYRDPRSLTPAMVERERQAGYPSLDAFHRQVAIDFVLEAASVATIAKKHEIPSSQVHLLFALPLLRAFMSDLQKEYMAYKLIDAGWIEAQIIKNMPKLEGDEPVPCVTRDGDEVMRHKYHAKELIAIFKHFGGNADQKKVGGVHVSIDFGSLGVRMDDDSAPHTILDV